MAQGCEQPLPLIAPMVGAMLAMRMWEETMRTFKQAEIDELFENIKSLARFGQNTTLRRALSYFEPYVSSDMKHNLRCTGGGVGGGAGDDCGYSTENPFDDGICPFIPNIHERQSERYRRSESSGSKSALIEMFIDFKLGKVDVLELEGVNSEEAKNADIQANEYIRRFRGVVVTAPGIDDELVRQSLLAAAHDIEMRSKVRAPKIEPFKNNDIVLLQSRGCVYQNTEYGVTEWKDNGKTLVQYVRDVYRCEDVDLCCDNHVYTKYGDWTPRVIWTDSGKPSDPPPNGIVPPIFSPYPYNNACALFKDSSGINVTSDYGWRNINGIAKFHQGMDLAAAAGTTVLSDIEGTIVHVDATSSDGETGVIVKSPGNEINQFWHIVPKKGLSENKKIKVGDVLGVVSSKTSAIHLHRARYIVPSGKWEEKSPANSVEPCPALFAPLP